MRCAPRGGVLRLHGAAPLLLLLLRPLICMGRCLCSCCMWAAVCGRAILCACAPAILCARAPVPVLALQHGMCPYNQIIPTMTQGINMAMMFSSAFGGGGGGNDEF